MVQGFRISGLGFRGFRVCSWGLEWGGARSLLQQSLGFRAWGLRSRVKSLGFRVYYLG